MIGKAKALAKVGNLKNEQGIGKRNSSVPGTSRRVA
jgi:hypothetical protein